VILATFAEMTPDEARQHEPTVIRVDAKNRRRSAERELPGPVLDSIGLLT
jgi:aspartate 1-decarboxylase